MYFDIVLESFFRGCLSWKRRKKVVEVTARRSLVGGSRKEKATSFCRSSISSEKGKGSKITPRSDSIIRHGEEDKVWRGGGTEEKK